jgi:hypothetical protein
MKMKLTLMIAAGILAVPFPSLTVRAGSNEEFDEFLTFNNNQVPAGWAITFPYGGPGRNAQVEDRRFEIGEVDTYAALEKAKTLPVGATEVHISFKCSVMNVYWGTGYQIHLLTSDGGDFVVGFGKEGFGNRVFDAYAGDYYNLEYRQTYTPKYGTYILDAVFKTGEIDLTVSRPRDGQIFASATVVVPDLDVTKLQLVRLFGIMTTNASPAWIDNALIEALY